MKKVSFGALMRHIIYLSLFALLAAPKGAPPTLTSSTLDRQLGHLKNISKITADFTQIRWVKEWGTEIKTTGTFAVQKQPAPQVVWKVLTPSYTAMKMEKQKLFVQTGTDTSPWKALTNPKVVSQMKSVFAWLSMDADAITKDFNVTQAEKGSFLLKPKKKGSIFQSIAIQLNKKKLVEKIVMTEHNTDSIRLNFSNTRLKK